MLGCPHQSWGNFCVDYLEGAGCFKAPEEEPRERVGEPLWGGVRKGKPSGAGTQRMKGCAAWAQEGPAELNGILPASAHLIGTRLFVGPAWISQASSPPLHPTLPGPSLQKALVCPPHTPPSSPKPLLGVSHPPWPLNQYLLNEQLLL